MFEKPPLMQAGTGQLTPTSAPSAGDPDLVQWDQFAQNLLLTVQAFQRLHTALDAKFTR